jgi:hypothetical protein
MCQEDEFLPVLLGNIKAYVGVEVKRRTFLKLRPGRGEGTFGPLALETNPVPTGYEAGLNPMPAGTLKRTRSSRKN